VFGNDLACDRGTAAERVVPHRAEQVVRVFHRCDRDEAPLARDVQRIESEQFARGPHRFDHAAQVRERQTFFEDERGGQSERARPADGEVVDRAVDRELADVAGKNSGLTKYESVVSARRARDLYRRLIFQRVQHLVAERREEHRSQ
jgi:hypothetical protein